MLAMTQHDRSIATGSGANLAFAVMVLASFFATLSTVREISIPLLTATILLGITYLGIGIYGYAIVARHENLTWRLLYFLVQIPLGLLLVFLDGQSGFDFMALLPLAGHSVVLLRGAWRNLVNLGLLVIYTLLCFLLGGGWPAAWASLPVFLAGQIFILVFTQMALNEQLARQEVQKLVENLETANQRLREYAAQAEELAITRERNRLAREIHDGLGHHLTTINIQIRAARAILAENQTRALELLEKAEGLTQQALQDVRQSVAALRSPFIGGPLEHQLQTILKAAENTGLKTSLQILGNPCLLPPQIVLTLLRAVQEGLNNTIKHSQASQFSVSLDFSNPARVCLSLADNGIGASESPLEGFGLMGMRERVAQLGGTIVLDTAPGQGFRIQMILPLGENNGQDQDSSG